MNKKTFSMMIEFNKFIKDYLVNNSEVDIFCTASFLMYNISADNLFKTLLVHKNNDETLIPEVLQNHLFNENVSISKEGGYLSKKITEFISDDLIAAHFYIITINSNFYHYSAYRQKDLLPESILYFFNQFIQSSSNENKEIYFKASLSFISKRHSFYNIYNAFQKDPIILKALLKSSFFKDECKSRLPALSYLLDEDPSGAEIYIKTIIDNDNDFLKSLILEELNKKNKEHSLSYLKPQLTNKINEKINIPSFSLLQTEIEEEVFWENKTIIPLKVLSDEFNKQNINVSNIFNNMFFRVIESYNYVNHIFHCSLIDKNIVFHTILKSKDQKSLENQLKYIGNINNFNEFFLGTIIQDFQDKNNRFSCVLNQYSTKNLEAMSIYKFQKSYFPSTDSILNEYRKILLSNDLKDIKNQSQTRNKKKI